MIDIHSLTECEFEQLPIISEGESKQVRYAGGGLSVIKFKPTIYSFTHNRSGIIEGSEILRMKLSKVFINELKKHGVKHAYREISDRWVLSDTIYSPRNQYVPRDIDISTLKMATPIEVIIKASHVGTPKHRYYKMSSYPVRTDHPEFPGVVIEDDKKYPEVFVRFDWRNPLKSDSGERLADEVLCESQADWFINTHKAKETGLKVFSCLNRFLDKFHIECIDLCLIIASDGETVFGEISSDCGRFKCMGSDLDKDVWRLGGSSNDVLTKWNRLWELVR